MHVLLHIAAWAILLGLPFYNFYRFEVPKQYIIGFYINTVINGLIFYGNYLILIPRYFLKNLRLKFYISSVVLILTLFIVSVFTSNLAFNIIARNNPQDHIERIDNDRNDQGRHAERPHFLRLPFGPMHLYNYTFNALVFTVFALGLRVISRHAEIEKRQKELEKEMLNSELAFLKNQISPHFFFNTLNNIYSLIGISAVDSQEAILKLSKLMRYLLYDSEQGETRLSNEIEFMNNYIDLMRLRLSEKVQLDVSFPEKYENLTIPPLLFISVIENAFKHGISYREKSFVDIRMDVSKEMINFRCTNSYFKKVKETDNPSGIGLENLKKRLALLFPDSHKLEIQTSETSFYVGMQIMLRKT